MTGSEYDVARFRLCAYADVHYRKGRSGIPAAIGKAVLFRNEVDERMVDVETRSSGEPESWRGDVIIVGGGILGLAVGRELLRRRPDVRLVLLEKESDLANGQTGHNSGVIHRGIYYKPGTLKASLCVAGAAELVLYCEEHSVPYRLCGKMIVATDPSELGRLDDLLDRAQANGVPDVRIVETAELREREPHCEGIRALWSPHTGIVDYRLVARAYANEIQTMGGEIRVDHAVTGMQRFGKKTVVRAAGSEFKAPAVISCAGLYSDRVAAFSGAAESPVIVPFRGDYFVLRPDRRYLVNSNIYPVPDPRFPFLGVHFTPRANGDIWLGPNAVLAFSRSGYQFSNVNVYDLRGIFGSKGFRTFARRNWRTGFSEMERDVRKSSFLKSLQRYIPELTEDDLLPGPSGVRAQALTPTGEMVDDFVIDEQPGILHVRNAPSPAATSSLQIGRYVVDKLATQFPEYAVESHRLVG
jgi:L-2-hydroxyglutarate oxidase LhgO